jgi:hypothetical protein
MTVAGQAVFVGVDATRVYVPSQMWIATVPIGGTTSTPLLGFAGANLAMDASFVYFADQKDKWVRRTAKAGGGPVTLANPAPATPDQVAIDATYVYFTTCNGSQQSVIYRTPK